MIDFENIDIAIAKLKDVRTCLCKHMIESSDVETSVSGMNTELNVLIERLEGYKIEKVRNKGLEEGVPDED